MSELRPVLEIQNASVLYDSAAGIVNAVRDVNLTIYPNTIVGLVGESGSGKSTLANAIMRLMKNNAHLSNGTISVSGQNVYDLSSKALRKFRWNKMSMVFQSAMSALNPVMNIEQQIVDVFRSHRPDMSRREIMKKVYELLDLVRIDKKHLKSFPHELSGGMKQRIVIAIAIALEPDLVIMDEPTTALDVVMQRSILDEIRAIQQEKQFAILFISHDFSLVSELAQQVAIMYAGRIVERTPSRFLMGTTNHHPYTNGLMRAIPKLTAGDVSIEGIPGNPPNLVDLPGGCAFHPRCPVANEHCQNVHPKRITIGELEVECHLFDKTVQGSVTHV